MTAAFVCSTASHEALKRDPAAWRALPFVGIQLCGDFDDALELRNCAAPDCCSTMCRPIGVQLTAERAERAARAWSQLGVDGALYVLAEHAERRGNEWRMGGAS